ncbi:MAG: prepilin-type N-terminal cleavage/methylation domain-containing protein [Gammaproteobacteria bacterium]
MSGFTLVELIIALLILSFVMLLCASGFKFGTRVWDSVNTQSEQLDSLQAAQGFLRKSISSALINDRLVEDEKEIQQAVFIGNEKKLRYVSYSPQYGVDDYLYKYELFLDSEKNNLSLIYKPYNLQLAANKQNQESIIIAGVKDISIEYFSGFETEESNNGWLTSWNDQFVLPLLIKIKLIFENDQASWPEMVIQMRNGPYVLR